MKCDDNFNKMCLTNRGFKQSLKTYFGTHWLVRIWRNNMDTVNRGYITKKDLVNL